MDSSNSETTSISTGSTRLPFVVISKELFCLIRPFKKMQLITTLDEVLEGLKLYICQKKLFDPLNPGRICCKNDQLGSVFGTSEFTVAEVKNYLPKLVSPISHKNYVKFLDSCSLTDGLSQKRKCDFEDDDAKRKCMFSSVTRQPPSPMFLHIPPSPVRHLTSDSSESIQGYETVFVKDTSDDTWSLTDSEVLPGESIVAVEETFDLEYEVESDSSSNGIICSESDTDSETEDALKTAILTLVACSDSDMEFWADNSSADDNSSDFDVEISEADLWQCKRCGSLNKPMMRFCLKCWDQKIGWVQHKQHERRPPSKRRLRRKRTKLEYENKSESMKTEVSCSSSQYDKASTSQESSEPSYSQEVTCLSSDASASLSYYNKKAMPLCMLCCSKPANASIVHKKFAHQVCCYECGSKLQKKKMRCPICRRKIDQVVYQIAVV